MTARVKGHSGLTDFDHMSLVGRLSSGSPDNGGFIEREDDGFGFEAELRGVKGELSAVMREVRNEKSGWKEKGEKN